MSHKKILTKKAGQKLYNALQKGKEEAKKSRGKVHKVIHKKYKQK